MSTCHVHRIEKIEQSHRNPLSTRHIVIDNASRGGRIGPRPPRGSDLFESFARVGRCLPRHIVKSAAAGSSDATFLGMGSHGHATAEGINHNRRQIVKASA